MNVGHVQDSKMKLRLRDKPSEQEMELSEENALKQQNENLSHAVADLKEMLAKQKEEWSKENETLEKHQKVYWRIS
jgi:hypothetical protein